MPNLEVPTANGTVQIENEPGASVVILGANGSGKTRLGVWMEQKLGTHTEVHRIGAHRSLVMNTDIQAPSYEIATNRLFYGDDSGLPQSRVRSRWQNKPATALLTDFDYLIAALYADENSISVRHRRAHLGDKGAEPPVTKLDRLQEIWQSILPHRELVVADSNLRVRPANALADEYDASELSDGERVIFYLIGQVLLTKPSSTVIVDEPDLHINKSVVAKLWDAIEGERKDCSFIYFTHDLEFAISRRATTKYFLRSYTQAGTQEEGLENWKIDLIPDDTNIPDEVIAKIVGSRKPILFIEGDGGSLDSAIYRRAYDDFTIIPVGSCEAVIHSVASFKAHAKLHWLGCAGLVDADGQDAKQIATHNSKGVHVLPVSEVENLLLLPKPFLALAKLKQFDDNAAKQKLSDLNVIVLTKAKADADKFSIEYTRRRIDAEMKLVGLTAKSITDLETEFKTKTARIGPLAIFDKVRKMFGDATDARDYETVLKFYSNKGLLSDAAALLGEKGTKGLEGFVGRALSNDSGKELLAALKAELPSVSL